MPINTEKKTETKKKTGKNALAFHSYLDDYFGLIILIFVLAVFIGSFFFIWYPCLLGSIDTVNNVKMQLDDEKGQLERYRNSIIAYKEAHDGVSSIDKAKINDMIGLWYQYPAIYHVDLVITLQDLLSGGDYYLADVKVVDIDLSTGNTSKKKKTVETVETKEEELPQGIVAIVVELEIENINYNGLKEVLFLLEGKLRLADISNIKFSPDKETCSIELTTYRFDKEE